MTRPADLAMVLRVARSIRLQMFLVLVFLGLAAYVQASDWRVMYIGPPPSGSEPATGLLHHVLNAWHGVLEALEAIGLLSRELTETAIQSGHSLSGFFIFLAGVFFIVSLWRLSRLLVLPTVDGHDMESAPIEPRLEDRAGQAPGLGAAPDHSQTARSLVTAQLTVTNLLLDPQAQQFEPELRELQKEITSALERVKSSGPDPQTRTSRS